MGSGHPAITPQMARHKRLDHPHLRDITHDIRWHDAFRCEDRFDAWVPNVCAWCVATRTPCTLAGMRRTLSILVVALVASLVVGCGGSGNARAPLPSAADQASYAAKYPAELDRLSKDLAQNEQDARAIMTSWDTMPADVAGAKDLDVKGLVAKADRAGKSDGYANERKSYDVVRAFHKDEQGEIGKKVFGYVDFAAKGKCHEGESLGGAAVAGVKDGVDKSLERRIRDANEATAFLEDEKGLDKATHDKLAKRLDDVAYASYLVHVAIGDTKAALVQRSGEASQVRSTLDQAVKEQKARADDTSRPEPARKASAKRAEELGQARASIDALAERAKVGLEQADARIQQLTKDYDAKLSELSQKLPTGKK